MRTAETLAATMDIAKMADLVTMVPKLRWKKKTVTVSLSRMTTVDGNGANLIGRGTAQSAKESDILLGNVSSECFYIVLQAQKVCDCKWTACLP